jgi:hypothetical protein
VSFFTVEDALEAPDALLDSEADRKKWRIVKVPEHEISGGVTFYLVQAYLSQILRKWKEKFIFFSFSALVF